MLQDAIIPALFNNDNLLIKIHSHFNFVHWTFICKYKNILKKKIVTAAELVAARALLTAGRNMVEKLSENTAPQISASEVTWNPDQGTVLFKL